MYVVAECVCGCIKKLFQCQVFCTATVPNTRYLLHVAVVLHVLFSKACNFKTTQPILLLFSYLSIENWNMTKSASKKQFISVYHPDRQ